MNAPSRGMRHVLSNSGFFDFSHCRLFPLRYRLSARIETIASRPNSQTLPNMIAPLAEEVLAGLHLLEVKARPHTKEPGARWVTWVRQDFP
jgi:hypothetical protein